MAPGGGFLRSLSQRLTGNRAKHRRPPPPPAAPATVVANGVAEHPQQCNTTTTQQQQQQQQQQLPLPVVASSNFGGGRRVCQCRVQLLDRTYVDVVLPKSAMAKELYDRVFAHMELDERDYFGLQFTDHFHVHHWLDPSKKVRKQMSIGPPYTFRFRVKFFSSEPVNLREELTRYQFFLQLRHDIQTGRLECPRDSVIDLAALALQSEFGDYNPKEHSMEFVSEFRFHPAQDEQMERDVLHSYGTKCGGMSPSQAELAYLNRARLLDFYGVDIHSVEGRDGNAYRLGLTPVGMQVFDGRQKIGLFVWEKIQRLDFRGRKLTLVVEEDLEQPQKCAGQLVQLHTFVFELSSHKACKHLWKCAIEYHTFYRLKYHHHHPLNRPNRVQLFRLGSTFRHRGRTEYEALHRDEFGRCQPSAAPERASSISDQFARRPSQRYAPRHRLTRVDELGMALGGSTSAVHKGTKVPTAYVVPPGDQPNGGGTGIHSTSAIPVPSNLPVKKTVYDNANGSNEYVTTIQISRGKAAQQQQPNPPEGRGVSRIPSLIISAGSSAAAAQSTKFVVTNSTASTSVVSAAPPPLPFHQGKCTQIPVIRTARPALADRGMATEL
uniref:Moesin/ezrin/radixin homolog 1 n=1 Tax=Globodera rostochiensis TaxID=31243 RepID=A0A914HVV4_GLORO